MTPSRSRKSALVSIQSPNPLLTGIFAASGSALPFACPRAATELTGLIAKLAAQRNVYSTNQATSKNGPDRPLELDLKTQSRSDYADSDIRRLDLPFGRFDRAEPTPLTQKSARCIRARP